MFRELREWRIPAETSPAVNDRVFKERFAPFAKEYKEKPVTRRSIKKVWDGFYGVLGDINGVKYDVSRCPYIKQEELAKINAENKGIVLLASNIFMPDGLAELCKVFPLRMAWTTDSKELLKISNSSKEGGCIVTQMQSNALYTSYGEDEMRENIVKQLECVHNDFSEEQMQEVVRKIDNLPYVTPPGGDDKRRNIVKQLECVHNDFSEEQMQEVVRKIDNLPYVTPPNGYSKDQLRKRIISDGGCDIRISTYMIASKFSQFIEGYSFDSETNSRILGSSYCGGDLAINTDHRGYFYVSKCSSDMAYSILGARLEIPLTEKKHFWENHHLGRKVA